MNGATDEHEQEQEHEQERQGHTPPHGPCLHSLRVSRNGS